MIVSRFAPSPTGRLHLGHAASALRAHDLARRAGGRFLIRIEDIDSSRSREGHVAAILDDLAWLGLAWDGAVVRQSRRLALYAAALDRLKERALVYPCFCTRAEIAASAGAPHGDAAPAYPGTCRILDEAERVTRMAAEPHCWRLHMTRALAAAARPPQGGEGVLAWHDATAGWVSADPSSQGDVVVARKDTPVSYHLAVTIDDAAQGVTDIVRGVDLFAATHIHRLLQALLALPTPRYHHHPLLLGGDGRRLAKRAGSPSLADLRGAGADPAALVAALRAGHLPIGFAAATP